MELHTFSSLNKEFLGQYSGAMAKATKAFVFFDPEVVAQKRLGLLTKQDVARAFGGENVTVFENAKDLIAELKKMDWKEKNLLMMSSGTFQKTNYSDLAQALIS